MSKEISHTLFYQSGETHCVVSEGITTHLSVDLAFPYLRLSAEMQEHCTASDKLKKHLLHIVSCIEELEAKVLQS